ncbi:MAG: glycosyltransferase family 39 protein [Anaerolineae bacterium]|nr:glycosyltransferase family 39 protein [Anaerolineae bacterium]
MWQSVKRSNVQRLTLIIFIYLVLAAVYSIVTPIGRGADEWAHYWYAQFIAQQGRLPLTPAEREAAGYKSDWPPLYHLGAAAATAWIETAGPPTFKYRAEPEHIRRQIIPAPRSEAILHTEDELFPWRQEILVWHLGRFLSIAFSLGTLLVTYRLALEVFAGSKVASSKVASSRRARGQGGRGDLAFSPLRLRTPAPLLALSTTAFLAFIPRFLFTGMLFNYDSLTLLIASLFLWLSLRIAKGYYSRWGFWGLGALAGLALLTKYLTALLPLEIIFLAFMSRGAGGQGGRGENKPSPLLKLRQATLAFILVISPWFGYLLVNFNEVETYGPVLGVVAPLLRGDGSDRTVEQLFAWVSGGQAPPPAHIDQQHYSFWQLLTQFFATFWTNPIGQPSLLDGFTIAMTLIALVSVLGLVIGWRSTLASAPASRRRLLSLLLLHCSLPVPLMLIRLFGARDALEAVQGRHILFLAGPAVVILLVWGLSRLTPHASRLTFQALISLLLTGSILQLLSMWQNYPAPLPVQTMPYPVVDAVTPPVSVELPGGAALVATQVKQVDSALRVTLFWQGGLASAPEDYQMELALVDGQGQTRSSWLGYQTQARYPTRVWEAGDTIRDEAWLPLAGLARGDYDLRLRILGQSGPVVDWQTLSSYTLTEPVNERYNESSAWVLWQEGQVVSSLPLFKERETAQFTSADFSSPSAALQLIGPDAVSRAAVVTGNGWANFIIEPEWPAGEYRWQPEGEVVLRVAPGQRNFQLPLVTHPLEANFAGQVKLLGYDLPQRRVQPGEGLPLTLYWQGLRWLGEDFVIFERLLDNQEMAWGGYDRRAKENYSTLFWAPGEIVTDGFAVPVDAAAPPGVYHLSLGWYRQVGEQAESLAIINPETGQPTESTAVMIGPIKVGGPPAGVTVTAANPQYELDIVLGDQIKLLGFDLMNQQAGAAVKSGSSSKPNLPTFQSSNLLHLKLYWQALAAPQTDYTVFTHVRNTAGETVAQKDNPPAGGAYPTSLWDAGEIIKDEIGIPLEHVAPGEYEIVVGMYDFQTGLRLSVAENLNGEIVLAKVGVEAP